MWRKNVERGSDKEIKVQSLYLEFEDFLLRIVMKSLIAKCKQTKWQTDKSTKPISSIWITSFYNCNEHFDSKM